MNANDIDAVIEIEVQHAVRAISLGTDEAAVVFRKGRIEFVDAPMNGEGCLVTTGEPLYWLALLRTLFDDTDEANAMREALDAQFRVDCPPVGEH